MKSKSKMALMILISAFSMLVGFTDVHAATLVQTDVPDVYYTRRGGGKPYASAQYNTYDMDGKTVYCIEPGVDITIHEYEGAIGWINSPYSEETNRKIQLYGYYGYEYPGHQTMRYRMAAQALIWEETGGQIIEFWTEASGWGDFININYEKNEILKLVNSHYSAPSFNGDMRSLVIGESVTFTDTSNVLSKYEIFKTDGATSVINGNTLTVTPNTVGDIKVTLKQKSYTDDPTTIFVGLDGKSQKMGLFGLDDPLYAAVTLNVVGGTLEISKIDYDTNNSVAQGDATLKGAKYELLDENRNHITYLITDEFGSAKTERILAPDKTYILREVEASNGYLIDPTEHQVVIGKNNLDLKLNVSEKVMKRGVEVFKVFASGETGILTPEPNITFDIYLKSSGQYYDSVTTNSKGYASITLPYGTWVWKQKTTTEHYEKVDDFEVVIDNNSSESITKIISNAEITSKLKVVKVDSESNKVLVRDGIKFRIKNLDTGNYVCQNITYPTQSKVCIFETTDGAFVTPYAISLGNYQIEELEEQTIEGYVWNSQPLKFSITDTSDFVYDDDFGVMVEVQFENKQVKGEVEINKVGETYKIEDGKFIYEEIPLSDVFYELYADGDIYSQDGTLIYKDKELVTSFVTKNGTYKITDLYLGKYCLYEVSTDINHILGEPYYFELKYKDQYTDIVSLSIQLKNYLKKSDLDFTKVDFSTSEPIPNTTIEIYIEQENGDILVGSYITDENGKVTIKDMPVISGMKYYILETNAADGFILNEEKMYFEFTENGEVIKSTMTNEKIKSTVRIYKVDEEGNALAGVKIGIYDLEGNEIGVYTTNEFGEIEVELEYKDYMYKELETLDGYILDQTEYYFSVTEDSEVIELTLVNEMEEIEVPNTSSNSYFILIPISTLGVGIVLLVIAKRKKNKKV